MKGTCSACASFAPSVDLPAPRRPSSAMRATLAAAPCSHRDVALARFQLCQVALRDAGGEGERLARHGVVGAPGAHAVAEPGQVRGFGLVIAVQREVRGAHAL
jgi:ribosomal protein S14